MRYGQLSLSWPFYPQSGGQGFRCRGRRCQPRLYLRRRGIGHTEGVEKVDALIRASRQVKRMLDRGTTRPSGLAEFYLLFVLAQETLGETVTLQAG